MASFGPAWVGITFLTSFLVFLFSKIALILLKRRSGEGVGEGHSADFISIENSDDFSTIRKILRVVFFLSWLLGMSMLLLLFLINEFPELLN